MSFKRFSFLLLLFFIATITRAQNTATLSGSVLDSLGKKMPAVSISIPGSGKGVSSRNDGSFKITLPADSSVSVAFSFIGYETQRFLLNLKPGQEKKVNITMKQKAQNIKIHTVEAEQNRTSNLIKIDPKFTEKLPSPTGNFESVLFTMPGVASNNELSSTYNVRGGNFDENLIYVNDMEVYRPFLIRSGQQEGLSFTNPDLVDNVLFSAGGFDAVYGDKMSSVLDIKYKRPSKPEGSAAISLLGATGHYGDASTDYRFTQIHGVRYRTNQYVLQGLQTQAEYQPQFIDYQGFFTYQINTELELGLLLNVSRNQYLFIPQSRETEFGNVNEALQLSIFFEGQEVDSYSTGTAALSATYKPTKKTSLRLISSIFRTVESETFDIQGAYRLDELDRDLGSDNFGEVKFNRGVGGFINHARNYLEANVANLQHKGTHYGNFARLDWGVRYQMEQISDQLKEWEYQDSTGYSSPQGVETLNFSYLPTDTLNPVPNSPRNSIDMKRSVRSNNDIFSQRLMGYFQAKKTLDLDSNELSFTAGIRANYWDFNNQTTISPRASIAFKPNWKHDWLFRLAWGYYHQPPFYREMRNIDGVVNPNIRAQESIHYVLGSDYNFQMFDRPFKLTTEAYYKRYNDLIPYEIDNVRIRYYAENSSEGYAGGLDFRVFGEFVKGIDSWITVGFMKTEEDLKNDSYWERYNKEGELIIPNYTFDQVAVDSTQFFPDFIPRPTDQRFRFSIFFQDYVPKIPDLKVNLNFIFASGLPFGPPSFNRYQDTLRMPPYRRVDVGFSYDIVKPDRKRRPEGKFQFVEKAWVAVEVFNMFGINNTISYLWIRDISDRIYGVPNFLTNRRLNVKLAARF